MVQLPGSLWKIIFKIDYKIEFVLSECCICTLFICGFQVIIRFFTNVGTLK